MTKTARSCPNYLLISQVALWDIFPQATIYQSPDIVPPPTPWNLAEPAQVNHVTTNWWDKHWTGNEERSLQSEVAASQVTFSLEIWISSSEKIGLDCQYQCSMPTSMPVTNGAFPVGQRNSLDWVSLPLVSFKCPLLSLSSDLLHIHTKCVSWEGEYHLFFLVFS